MANSYKTEQETFWAGQFGSDYSGRNTGDTLLASNLAFFTKALGAAGKFSSCIEFGANIGMNLKALQILFPGQEQHALEINSDAVVELSKLISPDNIQQTSILDFTPTRTWDLVLIKGVLIHIHPEWLGQVYDALHHASGRYLLICEYYNPTPIAINYRNHTERLFKRDFCGEILDRHNDLQLIDYGFAYHRDPKFPQDDINWFLIEKRC